MDLNNYSIQYNSYANPPISHPLIPLIQSNVCQSFAIFRISRQVNLFNNPTPSHTLHIMCATINVKYFQTFSNSSSAYTHPPTYTRQTTSTNLRTIHHYEILLVSGNSTTTIIQSPSLQTLLSDLLPFIAGCYQRIWISHFVPFK